MKAAKTKFKIAVIIFTLTQLHIIAYAQQTAIPGWFINAFRQHKLNEKYALKAYLKPAFLAADFNGDGVKDIAALIVEKNSKKKGIVIMHAATLTYFVFGAGYDNSNGGKNFSWADKWLLYNDKEAGETLYAKDGDIKGWKTHKLKRTGIIIWDVEDGFEYSGGIFYWNGKKYIWLQQGE